MTNCKRVRDCILFLVFLSLLLPMLSSVALAFQASHLTTINRGDLSGRHVRDNPMCNTQRKASSRRLLGSSLLSPMRSRPSTTSSLIQLADANTGPDSLDSNPTTSNNKVGVLGRIMEAIPPANERQKLFPLALMFFCILFNYTILRDTKDVLMVLNITQLLPYVVFLVLGLILSHLLKNFFV